MHLNLTNKVIEKNNTTINTDKNNNRYTLKKAKNPNASHQILREESKKEERNKK